ncbi:MAG TPA: DUF885 domain-containing protein [Acidimicrobiia bacterium]|nr:DUF885 domain-containing protein [Acidimicrobiia bacterium]
MTVAALADDYLARLAPLDPAAAALVGGSGEPWPDLSPDGVVGRYELDGTTASALRRAVPGDEFEERLRKVMLERLDASVALHEVGFTPRLLAPLATPLHQIQSRLESAPRHSERDRAELGRLLRAVPTTLEDHRATLAWARDRGWVASRRQIGIVAAQIRTWTGEGPAGVLSRLHLTLSDDPDLAGPAAYAVAAFAATADFLERDLGPAAPDRDGVGDEEYGVTARAFLGSSVGLDEVAEWGRTQVAELEAKAAALAELIEPGAGLDEVCRRLDSGRRIGRDEVEGWLQARVELATEAMSGWGLPHEVGDLSCRITESTGGVMFYSPAPPGGGRPGMVWWTLEGDSVPAWRQVTTVHHEGVPGHHLQHVMAATADLHPWQRHLCHVHGYAEGWAHHAEALAGELGLLDDPAEHLGFVLGQLHRACRIVADSALHLGPGPGRVAGWSVPEAVDYLQRVGRLDETTARFEVDRYLGWPAQALAFRVGARAWESLRAGAEKSQGPGFEPVRFYRRVLALGPMGLGPLADIAGGP